MIERILDYPGYLIKLSHEDRKIDNLKTAMLFYHGFPATRYVKNIDLAEACTRRTKRDSFLLHYRGLGESPGTFHFHASVGEGIAAAEFILNRLGYESLILCGHSWGGMVATNVACKLKDKIKKLLLISPLVKMSVEDRLFDELRSVKNDLPHLFGGAGDDEIRDDFKKTLDDYMIWDRVSDLPKNLSITLIQAQNDETTPASIAKELVKRSPTPIEYLELPLDHSFYGDRELLIKTLLSTINLAD